MSVIFDPDSKIGQLLAQGWSDEQKQAMRDLCDQALAIAEGQPKQEPTFEVNGKSQTLNDLMITQLCSALKDDHSLDAIPYVLGGSAIIAKQQQRKPIHRIDTNRIRESRRYDGSDIRELCNAYDYLLGRCVEIVNENALLKSRLKDCEWQPIETAPKDGKPILLLDSDKRKFVGFWLSQCEVDDLDVWDCEPLKAGFYVENYMGDHCERLDPTHWMPLQPTPKEVQP